MTIPVFSKQKLKAVSVKATPAQSDYVIIHDVASDALKRVLISDFNSDLGFLKNVVEDTTPQLGGQLDMNGQSILAGALTITPTELGYLDGVTSNLQAQINAISGVSDGDKGDITVSSSGAVWTIDTGLAATKIADGSVSNAEFQFLGNVTSDIQTQINAKQGLDATLTALAAHNTNGLLTQTAADTFTGRTLTGTANEITVTNGNGVSGNPTLSLPTALTFTGKTVTGGTFTGITDISVADGGTGKSSWTQWLIPYTDTTTSFSQIAIGSSGQVLTSNGAGAAPTFQNAASAGANTALSNLSAVAINATLLPGTDDAIALGSGTKEWSDLFLASGGVINFANGNFTITHASGVLTFTGGDIEMNTNGILNTAFVKLSGQSGNPAIFVEAQQSVDQDGADLEISGAEGNGTGATGMISIINPSGFPTRKARFDISSVSGVKTFSFPNISGIFALGSSAYLSTQFDKTNTTLADVSELTINVESGNIYHFQAVLFTTSNVAGGVKASIKGTATATAVIFEALVFNGAVISAETRATSLGTAVGGVTAVTAAKIVIEGSIEVNAGGTLLVQFAENAAVGTSSVLAGSYFSLIQTST